MTEEDNRPKQRRQYIITVEGVAPVKAQFTIWATEPQEAMDEFNSKMPQLRDRPHIDLVRMQRQKVTVKDAMTSLVVPVKS